MESSGPDWEMPLPPVPTPMKSVSKSPPLLEPTPESTPPAPLVRTPSSSPEWGWAAPGSAALVFCET